MDAAERSTFNGVLLSVIVILTLLLLYYLKPRAKLNIKGKYVLITGCDSGFGRATAIALDKMGVCVLATCLRKEGEQSLKSETSDKLKTFQLDVTNSEQIKEVRDKVNKLLVNGNADRLWGLVNNAGIVHRLPIEWTPLTIYKRTADVNLWGLIEMTKTFLPLVKRARGRVVNFSSGAGRFSVPFVSAYSITKYGVEAFSDALRREMYPWGVKVSILEPGAFQTNMSQPSHVEKSYKASWEILDDQLKEEYGEKFLNEVVKLWTEFPQSDRLYLVVDAVLDALTSQTPRDCYVVGSDAWFGIAMVSWLPTFVVDSIIRKLLKTALPKVVRKD